MRPAAWARAVAGVGLVLALSLAVFFRPRTGPAGSAPPGARYAVGDVVADQELLALDGQQVSLSAWKGKVVVLNFWASW